MRVFELCLWAWKKYRHKKINSIAKFRYALQALESSHNGSIGRGRMGAKAKGGLWLWLVWGGKSCGGKSCGIRSRTENS